MNRKSLLSSGNKYYVTSLQEIIDVYKQYDYDAGVTKDKLSDKYREKEVQSVIDSLEKIKNPDIRIASYRKKLEYLLWISLFLTAVPVPFLFFLSDLSPLIFAFSTVIGLLPFIIALAIFYSKLPPTYYVILFLYLALLVFFSPTDEIIDGISNFNSEPVFLLFFSLFIGLIVTRICVIFFSYKLLRLDDIATRIVSRYIEAT